LLLVRRIEIDGDTVEVVFRGYSPLRGLQPRSCLTLEDQLFQRQVGHHLAQPSVLSLELLQRAPPPRAVLQVSGLG